jgi:hypothetical protein
MDARRSPRWVLNDHSENQIANFLGDSLPANHLPRPRDCSPIQRESGAVPTDHSLRTDYHEGLFPATPKPSHKDPEKPIGHRQSRSRMLTFEYDKLLPKNQVFE